MSSSARHSAIVLMLRKAASLAPVQPDRLVDASKGRNGDGLTTDSSGTTDSGRVFTRARVDDRLEQNLDRVLAAGEVDDLERVFDDANGHQLLAVVDRASSTSSPNAPRSDIAPCETVSPGNGPRCGAETWRIGLCTPNSR